MIPRFIMILLLGAFIVSGCASPERRAQKIRAQYPQWEQGTVQKVAAREVEVGMSKEMVRTALGRPVYAVQEADLEKWGYAVYLQNGYSASQRFVYFVYFKDGVVVRTAGDSSQLKYWD